MKTSNLNFRINQQINAPDLRVIGADGKQFGVLKLRDALDKAAELGLDLVEIAPNAKPPVAKIVELGKFKYEQEKKLQKQKRATKASEIKEVRFSPFIAEHDFQNRIERIKEFLVDKQKVRVVVKFTGRQMDSSSFGYKLIERVVGYFKEVIVVDMEPKFLGRHLITVISPTNKISKVFKEQNNAKTKD